MIFLDISSAMHGKTALPLTSRQCLFIRGEDRIRYLNGQTTNDVKSLKQGSAIHAAVCTAKGKMQGEVFIANDGHQLLVDFPALLSDNLPQRLEKYIISDDVEMLSPKPLLRGFHFLGEPPPEVANASKIFLCPRFTQTGYDVWVEGELPPAIPLASDDITEWIRIRTGTPLWGKDITENNLPPEAYAENHTISYRKGCYIGQETIARIKSIGHVNRQLCLLQGRSPHLSCPRDIKLDGKIIGRISSAQTLPDQEGLFYALAMLSQAHSTKGTRLVVDGNDWEVLHPCG